MGAEGLESPQEVMDSCSFGVKGGAQCFVTVWEEERLETPLAVHCLPLQTVRACGQKSNCIPHADYREGKGVSPGRSLDCQV